MTGPRTPGPRTVTLVLAVAVAAATALALLPVPTVVHALLTFPLLVLVSGTSATRLLLAPRTPAPAGAPVADEGLDGLLRVVLPVLLGMLTLLAVVLLLAVVRIPIATTGIAVGTGVVALALLLTARWRTILAPSPAVAADRPAWGRRAVGAGFAVVVLAGAVAGAVALRPAPVEAYTQLALGGPGAGKPVTARPGTPVELPWTLRGYGTALPAREPAVRVTVGGTPATGVSARIGPIQGDPAPGGVDDRRGTVTFAAPTTAGLYDVRVDIGPATSSELVLRLEVTP